MIYSLHSSSKSRAMMSNTSPAVTSFLDSFQSSFRSISWKDSCDLGPFLISSTSMMKVSVLSGGILPDHEEGHHKKRSRKVRRCFLSQSEASNHNTVDYGKKVLGCFGHVLRQEDGKYGRHVSCCCSRLPEDSDSAAKHCSHAPCCENLLQKSRTEKRIYMHNMQYYEVRVKLMKHISKSASLRFPFCLCRW